MCHVTYHVTPSNQIFLEKKGRGRLHFLFDCDSMDPMELQYICWEEVSVLKYAFFAFWGELFDNN